MMDTSDGLSTDLARMARASNCGATIEAVPVAEAARAIAQRAGANADDWALNGGEDFELLIAVATRVVLASFRPLSRPLRASALTRRHGYGRVRSTPRRRLADRERRLGSRQRLDLALSDEAHESNLGLPYDIARVECGAEKPNLRKIHDLLFEGDAQGDTRATFALAIEYFGEGLGVVGIDEYHAVELLRKAVKGGNIDAMSGLGLEYQYGVYVRKKEHKAFKLYTAAALQGNAPAMYAIGYMLYRGKGVKKDRALARIWLDRAAELGEK